MAYMAYGMATITTTGMNVLGSKKAVTMHTKAPANRQRLSTVRWDISAIHQTDNPHSNQNRDQTHIACSHWQSLTDLKFVLTRLAYEGNAILFASRCDRHPNRQEIEREQNQIKDVRGR